MSRKLCYDSVVCRPPDQQEQSFLSSVKQGTERYGRFGNPLKRIRVQGILKTRDTACVRFEIRIPCGVSFLTCLDGLGRRN
jgi:hypothetical protein